MRIIIAGGREFTDYEFAKWNLDIIFQNLNKDEIVIISGGARGADTLAIQYAKEYNYKYEVYMADWDKYGRGAGPIRNKQMAVEGKADALVAFPGGRGTANMIQIATDLGLQIRVIEQ